MKILTAFMLLLVAGSFAQDTVPAGTILPAQLNSSLRSEKARPGDAIEARIMQDVPLPGNSPARSKIRAGTKIIGHVVDVRPARGAKVAAISLRFDSLVWGKKRIPVTTNLRAMASMMEVSGAQVPETGPDRGTSEFEWTTDQIGGEVNYRAGGIVADGLKTVGHSAMDSTLAPVRAKPGTECRSTVEGNDSPQALWLFSSDACGLYGFPELVLAHAGRTDPLGEITLVSRKGNVNLRAGSGVLLRVNR
jgi:hypothetical protein